MISSKILLFSLMVFFVSIFTIPVLSFTNPPSYHLLTTDDYDDGGDGALEIHDVYYSDDNGLWSFKIVTEADVNVSVNSYYVIMDQASDGFIEGAFGTYYDNGICYGAALAYLFDPHIPMGFYNMYANDTDLIQISGNTIEFQYNMSLDMSGWSFKAVTSTTINLLHDNSSPDPFPFYTDSTDFYAVSEFDFNLVLFVLFVLFVSGMGIKTKIRRRQMS